MEEFSVRLASNATSKKYNVFKLHKDDKVTWNEAKMKRENDYQPWQIKFGQGRAGRRFKAIKEGGVGDNASYFVFYKPSDKSDTYEVCPVDEWYNVSATQRYKTLTVEEAEQKFEQRHKMLNLFSVMHLKKNGEGREEAGNGQDSKAFKVSELDDWDESGDDDGSGFDDDDGEHSKKSKKKSVKKEDPDEAPEEAKEDSDEGDHEQKEVDYMSDSSSESYDSGPEEDEDDVKGIAEESALRDLLFTDDEEDLEADQQKGSKNNDNKNSLGTVSFKSDLDGNDSEDTSDSDDYDVDEEKMDSMFMKKGLPARLSMTKPEIKQEPEPSVSISSRQVTTSSKRKAPPETTLPAAQQPKRPCTTEFPSSPPNDQERIVEDLIKKYLSRKPMTLKTLLKDIKSKLKRMDGVTPQMNQDLVTAIANIIKRLQPDRQKINNVTYLSLKP